MIYARAHPRRAEADAARPSVQRRFEPDATLPELQPGSETAAVDSNPDPPFAESADALESEPLPLDEDALFEAKLRVFAIPGALLLAFLLLKSSLGQFFLRTFLSMWIHELGHAITAWIAGFTAFPGPWRTAIGEERSVVMVALVFALAAWIIRTGYRARRAGWLAAGGALLLAQAVCLMLRPTTAHALITFGGDGGCLVWGTALMCTFFVNVDHIFRTRGLRWGFLAIGAAAYADTFHTWWGSRSDTDMVPYGSIEGVGLSDPAKLVETYGWTVNQVINRYVTLGCVSALVLLAVYLAAARPFRLLPRRVAPASGRAL